MYYIYWFHASLFEDNLLPYVNRGPEVLVNTDYYVTLLNWTFGDIIIIILLLYSFVDFTHYNNMKQVSIFDNYWVNTWIVNNGW